MQFRIAGPWFIVIIAFFVGCSTPASTTPDEPITGQVESDVEAGAEGDAKAKPTHPLRVTFVGVGQADAILLQLGEVDILVDAGRSYTKELEMALKSTTGPLELLVLTHPHRDHYGGARDVLTDYTVTRVITNGERRGPPRDPEGSGVTWLRVEDELDEAGLQPEHLTRGDELSFGGGLTLRVLATGSPDGGSFPDTPSGSHINNDSLVLMVEFAGRRVLLTGDIETEAGEMLVEEYCADGPSDCPALKADVMKVPHHGSSHFHSEFFEAVRPTWAVVSADYDNPKGKHCLPRRVTAEALAGLGVGVLSTNSRGGRNVVVDVEADGDIRTEPTVSETDVFVWSHDDSGSCVAETCRLAGDGAMECEQQQVVETAR